MHKLSIVIPVYYNELTLNSLYEDLKKNVLNRSDVLFEMIMVDDGSNDNSWQLIKNLAKDDKRIKAIKLSRNFGSHAAILCGLANSTGDCAAVKAADMQEPSELLLQMYDEWLKGYNVVLAIRKAREDKKIFSELYYTITRKIALPNMPKHGFDIFLIDKKVIKVLENFDEKNSAITGQILWSGFKTKQIEYYRKAREIGESKWTLKKKIRLVMDTIFSFSTFPITLISFVGVISIILAIIISILLLILKNNNGYTILFVLQLLGFGIIMFTLGILGNYLWRTFDSSRNRPVYIVEDEDKND
jgi:polyisoprenyl-phosphate glycosyltransferase